MHIAVAINVNRRLIPAVQALRDAIGAEAREWRDIVKIDRTHMQDATPVTLDQSGRVIRPCSPRSVAAPNGRAL